MTETSKKTSKARPPLLSSLTKGLWNLVTGEVRCSPVYRKLIKEAGARSIGGVEMERVPVWAARRDDLHGETYKDHVKITFR